MISPSFFIRLSLNCYTRKIWETLTVCLYKKYSVERHLPQLLHNISIRQKQNSTTQKTIISYLSDLLFQFSPNIDFLLEYEPQSKEKVKDAKEKDPQGDSP